MGQTPSTIAQALREAASTRPDEEALVHGERRVSWRELERASAQVAAALHAHGVRKGDVVATFMPNCVEWIALFLGLGRIGAVAAPVNVRYTAAEASYVLQQCGASLLVCTVIDGGIDFGPVLREAMRIAGTQDAITVSGKLATPGARETPWQEFLESAIGPCPEEATSQDLLLIQYTSGTTAFPKGVELRQGQLLRSARAMADRLGMGAEDRFFSPMPFFHIGGSTASILTALAAGATLCFLDAFDAKEALRVLLDERCTVACGVDTMFVDILALAAFDPTQLCIRTGWTLYNEAVFAAIPGLMQVYALSECSSVVTICDWRDPVERRRDTCGQPIEGVELRIVDPEKGTELPADAAGRILVRGWCTTTGYYEQPDQTAKLLLEGGWLDTGDYGRLLVSGDLVFMGRLKDVLRVGGENVASSEVEVVLHAHPAVLRAAIVGLPHPRMKEVPLAFVMLRRAGSVTGPQLTEFCAGRLASFKVPRHIVFVTEFPMTGSGKIRKNVLAEEARKMAGETA